MSIPDSRSGSPLGNTGKTIDLQGVASFAGLVELLSQELGTTASRMHGNLPNGPASFDQLQGEIDLHNQGYSRRLTILARPGEPITLRVQSSLNNTKATDTKVDPVGGVVADFYIGATIEQVTPQGRALARYIEDIFAVLDRMVTLGQGNKLATMQISAAELQAFEASELETLVRHTGTNKSATNFGAY